MIKTEIETDEANAIPEEAEAQTEALQVMPISGPWPVAFIVVIVIIAAVFGSYLIYTNSSSTQSIPPARNIGNVPALPLETNTKTTAQATTSTGALSASSINLQNNLPSGQGSPKTNSLQTTGNSLSTGQTVNTNFPF